MQPVFLICGVPGSGKSWVCRQLAGQARYIPHDENYKNHAEVIIRTASMSIRKIITESPFAERELREKLESAGVKVYPYFVIEEPDLIKERYEKREGKPFPKNNCTRAKTIVNRAMEWKAPFGTSTRVLEMLKNEFISGTQS